MSAGIDLDTEIITVCAETVPSGPRRASGGVTHGTVPNAEQSGCVCRASKARNAGEILAGIPTMSIRSTTSIGSAIVGVTTTGVLHASCRGK